MHGDLSHKLTLVARRHSTLPTLPPPPTELLLAILSEVRSLDASSTALLAPYTATAPDGTQTSTFSPSADPATACALLINHLSTRRNKRCLLAYHRMRAERLEQWAWEGRDINDSQPAGASSAAAEAAAAPASSLSPEEQQYLARYADLLTSYKGQFSDIDLTGSLDPPRDLFIDVRVLKDAGEIQTEYGAINLTKNSQFYVRLGDVEELIRMGFLQRLS
jgi:GINS complex subunit 1